MNSRRKISSFKFKLQSSLLFCVFFLFLLILKNPLVKIPSFVAEILPLLRGRGQPFVSNAFRDKAMQIYKNKSDLVSYEQFFSYIENPVKNFCENNATIGGKWTILAKLTEKNKFREGDDATNKKNGWYIDGDKRVCFDARTFNGKDCVVISIGISTDWSFDDHITKYGCKVFAFDHTTSSVQFNRTKNIHFYPYGIGKKETKIGAKRLITLSKMFDIAKKVLNKTDIEISYLKIDVEGAELGLFKFWRNNTNILKYIKQIGMEIHPKSIPKKSPQRPNSRYKEYFKDFMFLEENRFVLFHSAMNPVPFNRYYSQRLKKYINGYYELVWGRW